MVFAWFVDRLLETLGEIDCDIHVPLDNMNMSVSILMSVLSLECEGDELMIRSH